MFYRAATPRTLEAIQRLKWLMGLRVLFITVLLGSLVVLQLYQEREPGTLLYLLVIATYILTIAYSLVVSRVSNLTLFAYFQIIADIMFVTGLIYATGGLDSPFTFLYILSILAAGFLLFRRGSFIVASLAGISYGALIDLQYFGMILSAPLRYYQPSELFYHIFLFLFAFFSVAFLSSNLSERLKTTKEELEEKSVDLVELQALNDSIVRSMADGMVTVGLDGIITGLNKAAQDITGLAIEDVRGRSFAEVFGLVGIESYYEDMDAGAAETKVLKRDIRFMRPDRELVLGFGILPLKSEAGEVTGFLGIFQDLTVLKNMEAEIKRKDRLAVIGELAAGMAHEIRNPLASLSGSIQVLKGNINLSDDDIKLMEIALMETDRLDNMVTEFLTYARPKEPIKQLTDVTRLVEDTVRLVSNSGELKAGVSLSAGLPGYPVHVVADPDQMKQVLLNLTNNALHAVGDGGNVELRAFEDGKGNVVLEVIDDGTGIPDEDHDKVFYPFYSTKPGGGGLGLSIVYRIVEDHGGNIMLSSVPGKGSTFKVTLPKEASF